MSEKKEPHKKTEREKKAEKDAMVNLWMSNLGAEEKSENEQKPSPSESQDQA